MSIRIGIAPGTWQWSNASSFFDFVEACESHGWDSLWLSDRLVTDRVTLEPVTALAAAAARTTRLKFGTSVLALPLRNPAMLAKELATVDFLSGGRLFPAVGLGGDDVREYEATGSRKGERGARTDEAIGLLRRLWTEDHVTHHGRFYHLTDVTITPKPIFSPYPPLWIGGRTAYAWELVGRLGDGWLVSSAPPDEVAQGIAAIRMAAAEHERRVEDDHYGVMLPTYLGATREAARERAATTPRNRTDVPYDAYSALGTTEAILAQIDAYVAAGATKFVFRLVCSEAETKDQLRSLAAEVLPSVNARNVTV
jgi:probable F420-dependent oxidoreductase